MFSKFVNNFYYGKSGKGDFNKSDLPKTRLELFFTTLKVRFTNLVVLNVLFAICCIPIFIIITKAISSYTNTLAAILEQNANILVENAQIRNEFAMFTRSLIGNTLIKLIPAIAILGIPSIAISYDLRNWARDEHAFIWSDMLDSIKNNWKQAIVISIINAILPFVCYIAYTFYGDMSKSNSIYSVAQIFIIISFIIWNLSNIFMYYLIINYKLSIFNVIRNAILLSIAKLPKVVLIKFMHIVPIIILGYIAIYYKLHIALFAMAIYYGVFGLVISRFINASLSNYCFETMINPRIEGAPTSIGVYKKDTKEYDIKNDDVYVDIEE